MKPALLIAGAVLGLLFAGQSQLGAQTPAPGGIGSGLEYWIRPEEMQVTSGQVMNWDDVYGLHADEQHSGRFTVTTGFNFNRTASSNANAYLAFLGKRLLSGATAGEVFHVLQSTGAAGTTVGSPSEFGGGTVAGWRYDGAGRDILSGWGSTTRKQWNPLTPASGPPREVRDPHIYNLLSKAGEWTARFDGLTNFTTATNAVAFDQSPSSHTYAGASHFSVFRGRLSEVIVYRRELTAAERSRVQSYMATKYGVTLGTTAAPLDYIASDGTTVFWTGSATWQNNIAGIGRDDASGLVQRQSQSVNTADSGNLVTMGLSTIAVDNASNPNNFGADRSFLAWGDDGASTSFATPIATPAFGQGVRMARVWRAQETGTVGTVKVGVPATIASGALLYLVVSNDASFDATDQWVPLASFTAGAASYQAADFDFTTGQHFTFAMVPLTDLVITKTDGQTIYTPGTPITYSIVVTNVGPSNATGVSIADVVPADITGVTVTCTPSGTASCGTNGSSGNNVSFTNVSIAAGAGNQLSISVAGTVSPAATASLTNTATVTPGAGFSDPNTANNTATDTDTPAQADLSITKAGPATATPGGTLTYTLTVTNNGPQLATAVSVSDPTPAGLTFVSNSGACATAFPCALGDLAPGVARTITTTWQLPTSYTAPNPIVNTATVTSAIVDPDATNNTASVSTPLGAPQSDLQMVKNVSAAAVSPGQTFTYTLQVTNNGPSNAANVTVTDALPSQVTFSSSAAGCTAVGQTVTCPTIPTLAAGALATIDIVVQLNPLYSGDGTDVLNSATVTSDSNDPALQNNTNPAGAPPVGPAGADVTIVKTVSSDPVSPGQTFTYNLLVSNQGPASATDVVATDPLPAPMTFVSSPQGCTAAGQDVTCPTIPTLNPGEFTTFTLVVQLDPTYAGDGSDLGNRATVQSPTPDPTPGNNTTPPVAPTVGSASADLSTTKVTLDASVSPGQTTTYRITVTNAGPSAAQSITVTDTLPGPLQFVSSPQGCTAAGQVVTCLQPSLAPGAMATFDLVVRLDPAYAGNGSDLNNTATTTSPTPDPGPSNNTTPPVPPPTVMLGSADLTLDKSGPAGSVPGGGEITYTLVVTNQGPNAAPDVVVDDPTPSGLTFIGTSGDCTTAFPCALGTIMPGLSKTITARYSVAVGVTAISNTATVSSPAPDPKPSNNGATALTPTPAQTYYFSEGATGGFFDYDLSIANPHPLPAPVTMNFFTPDGPTVTETRTVPAQSRLTVRVDDIPGLEQTTVSVQVFSDSGLPLAVERSMFWDSASYAGHTGTAVTAPATRWHFAEGFQGYFFTYVLLENPGATPAEVTVTFLRETEAPFVKEVVVAPFTRLTVDAYENLAELSGRAFGIVVDSTQPIVAERSMYFNSTAGRLWEGGHSSAGVTEPTWRWFLAEGATGGFFDLWILLSNPQSVDAHVTLDYQLEDGSVVSVPKVVPAQRRLTVSVDQEADPRLHNASVSTRVSSDVPIVAERSMYWGGKPEANPWGEGHNSFGMTESALRWAVGEGRVGGPLNYQTYLLLANPQDAAAEVTVTYLRENGASPVVKTYTVPATTRFNIDVKTDVPELQNESFGALIEVTNGVTIAVERSMYWDADGVFWSGGSNAPGTKLP